MARFTSPDGTGAPGPVGPPGPAGTNGVDGIGIPEGGLGGQILAKIDDVSYNAEWIDNWSTYSGYTNVLKHEVKAGVALTKGQAVYVSSADGTNMIVSKASNSGEATSSKTLGLIENSVSLNGKTNVITEGLLAGLNTNGANAGDPVWLGTNGSLIFGLANKPVAPAHLVFIGIVTRANSNNGEIFIRPQNGFEVNELHDVLIGTGYSSTAANNDLLAFDTASGLWKNKTISNVTGLIHDGSNLSVPGLLNITASSGDEGGEILLNKPQTNTTINGGVTIDVYQNKLRIFEQNGNTRGVHLDFTELPSGVSGELLVKASGFVNAGVDVTLGNLKARIPTSGNRSLQLSTISGTMNVYGSGVYSQNGVSGTTINASSPLTLTTTPAYLVPSYQFVTAGATDTWILRDVDNTIAWRITMVMGPSFNNNFISIERL